MANFFDFCLLPCPTCGKEPVVSMADTPTLGTYWIRCPQHYAANGNTMLWAVDRWNTLASLMKDAKEAEMRDDEMYDQTSGVGTHNHKMDCGCDYDPRDTTWYSFETSPSEEDRVWTWEDEEDDIEDNWAHRSEGMRCDTCMFYVPKALSHEANHSPTVGRCRRHAPTMNGYPVVFVDDWCGDHKLDEEKI